ncbi:MAG: serine hydrolase [Bacteroidota bacterium]
MYSQRCLVFFLSCLLCLLVLPATAQAPYYPPPGSWESRSPAEMGFNPDSLAAAVGFAKANEYTGAKDLRVAILQGFAREPYHKLAGPTKKRGGPAGLILRKGYIVAQWGDVERVDMTFSVTKSYLSTVAGLAVDAGRIRSTADPVARYVWDGTFAGEHNTGITWGQLLTQSSDWSGELFGMKDWADRPPREGGLDDWKFRKLAEPGAQFEYNDVRVNVLAYSLLQVWRRPLPMVLKEKIMEPIGASTTWRWYGYENSFVNVDGMMMQSVSGGGHSGGGIFISTLDHARFGLLFARRGRWRQQQLISEDWIAEALQPSAANASYGYMWWLNQGPRAWKGVEVAAYYAAGFGGNFIVIIDAYDLVIVTRWLQPSEIGTMVSKVLAAVEQ